MIEDNKNNNEFEEQFKKKLFENVRAISASLRSSDDAYWFFILI